MYQILQRSIITEGNKTTKQLLEQKWLTNEDKLIFKRLMSLEKLNRIGIAKYTGVDTLENLIDN